MTPDNEACLPQDDIDVEIVDVQEVIATPGRRPSGSACSLGIPERDDLKVYVSRTVLAGVLAHLRSDTTRELGGLLLGQLQEDAGDHYLDISDSLPAEHTESSGLHLRFTLKTWEAADRERERRYPEGEKIVVGWYHSHPGLGVFVSSHDQQVHKQFHSWWQVAIVVDPKKAEFGCFRARGDWLLMCSGLYLYGEAETAQGGELAYVAVPPIRQTVAGQQEPSKDANSQDASRRSKAGPIPSIGISKLVALIALLAGCASGFLLGTSLAGATSSSTTAAVRQLPSEIATELLSAADRAGDQIPVSQSDVLLGVLCIGGDQTTAAQATSHLRASLWSRRFNITSQLFTNFLSKPEQSPTALTESIEQLHAISKGNGKREAIAEFLGDCFSARQDLLFPQPLETESMPLAENLGSLSKLFIQVSSLEMTRSSLKDAIRGSSIHDGPEAQRLFDAFSGDVRVKTTMAKIENSLKLALEQAEAAELNDNLFATLRDLRDALPDKSHAAQRKRIDNLIKPNRDTDHGGSGKENSR